MSVPYAKTHALIGDNFFIVLHEASKPKVSPVICVGHFLQAGQSGIGLRAVKFVHATGQPAYGRTTPVSHAARHGRDAPILDDGNFVGLHRQAVGKSCGILVPEACRVPIARSRYHVFLEYLRKLYRVGAEECHRAVDRKPAATSGRSAVPHVCAHVNLEVSFGGESSTTYAAGKRFFPRVGPLMDLQCTRRGEALPTGVAEVLFRRPPWRCSRQYRGSGGRGCDQARGHIFMLCVETVEEAIDLRFVKGANRKEGRGWTGGEAGI